MKTQMAFLVQFDCHESLIEECSTFSKGGLTSNPLLSVKLILLSRYVDLISCMLSYYLGGIGSFKCIQSIFSLSLNPSLEQRRRETSQGQCFLHCLRKFSVPYTLFSLPPFVQTPKRIDLEAKITIKTAKNKRYKILMKINE